MSKTTAPIGQQFLQDDTINFRNGTNPSAYHQTLLNFQLGDPGAYNLAGFRVNPDSIEIGQMQSDTENYLYRAIKESPNDNLPVDIDSLISQPAIPRGQFSSDDLSILFDDMRPAARPTSELAGAIDESKPTPASSIPTPRPIDVDNIDYLFKKLVETLGPDGSPEPREAGEPEPSAPNIEPPEFPPPRPNPLYGEGPSVVLTDFGSGSGGYGAIRLGN